MAIEHDIPKIPTPLRVLFEFESTGWFETSQEERKESILPKLSEILAGWEQYGARMVGTIDRDIFTAGAAGSKGWHACLLYDVPTWEAVAAMTNSFRATGLDRYFRLEAIVGRPFFLLEKAES
ncbi:hypothetical protein [Kyrpidia spormannii]|uniref:Uncharacterized protein n=2 Tax=Kyrpidia spormannii TaxID=2055160 RepID=A0A6F9ED97_9BACL|nr:hypothetical protein [Kyrpidia spormannii]CAB3393543.1 conserved protein of unknown function [Kyrpidia spormannii]CAB3394465.1 conserved protein of unknown function [Kyrpidia spormannii]